MSIIVPKPSPPPSFFLFCFVTGLLLQVALDPFVSLLEFFFFFFMRPAHVRGASDSQLYAMRKCVSMYINICVYDMIYE